MPNNNNTRYRTGLVRLPQINHLQGRRIHSEIRSYSTSKAAQFKNSEPIYVSTLKKQYWTTKSNMQVQPLPLENRSQKVQDHLIGRLQAINVWRLNMIPQGEVHPKATILSKPQKKTKRKKLLMRKLRAQVNNKSQPYTLDEYFDLSFK